MESSCDAVGVGGEEPLHQGSSARAEIDQHDAPVGWRTAPDHEVKRATRRVALCAVRVGGVPDISVEEALWAAAGIVSSGSR